MARDKLITIRIEGEKRDAFNQLAKSQNTDTASLLYDFINQCLVGTLDISLVTGKGNRLGNQIDNRLDKLETTTQRLDERLGIITKKLNDWIEAIDDRLNDSDQGLSEKTKSLEHRLNALAIQLDRQKIDTIEMTTQKIDTDSQKDSQRIDDMEPLLKLQREASIASPIPTIEENSPRDEPVEGAIETVPGETSKTSKGLNPTEAHNYLISQGIKAAPARRTLNDWVKQGKISGTSPQGKNTLKHLALRDGLYYPKD